MTDRNSKPVGFFVCVADLEDELIRALGTDAVEEVIAAEGEIGSFRTLQKQPAHGASPSRPQLRRFMGTTSGRKLHYARVLVEALDLAGCRRRSIGSSTGWSAARRLSVWG